MCWLNEWQGECVCSSMMTLFYQFLCFRCFSSGRRLFTFWLGAGLLSLTPAPSLTRRLSLRKAYVSWRVIKYSNDINMSRRLCCFAAQVELWSFGGLAPGDFADSVFSSLYFFASRPPCAWRQCSTFILAEGNVAHKHWLLKRWPTSNSNRIVLLMRQGGRALCVPALLHRRESLQLFFTTSSDQKCLTRAQFTKVLAL